MPRPPPVDPRWLRRAVLASLALHLVVGILARVVLGAPSSATGSRSLVDVELAPPAPVAERLPDQTERPRPAGQSRPAEAAEPDEPGQAVDARVDARPRRPHPDAAEQVADVTPDAAPTQVAIADAGGAADATLIAAGEPGAGSGDPGAVLTGDASLATGEPGTGADGTVSPGTAANLLAYVPADHVLAALIRFDRLRGTTWQEPVEKLFKPMPDHVTLIGTRDLHLADLFDTLVIASPQPDNATATTLVAKTHVDRPSLRDILDEPDTPVTWRAATGGMFGARRPGARVLRGDKRQFLSPYLGWIVLAQPRDLAGLTAAGSGDLDAVVARVPLPAWLDQIRHVEDETGSPDGPALIMTVAGTAPRYVVPDVGLDVVSVPAPERMTIALEIAPQGFIVRGNLRFASEADAIELVDSVGRARQRAVDSSVLRAILKRSRIFNAVKGLTLDRRGARVSYATSLSVADAEGLLAVAAQTLDAYFAEAARARQ